MGLRYGPLIVRWRLLGRIEIRFDISGPGRFGPILAGENVYKVTDGWDGKQGSHRTVGCRWLTAHEAISFPGGNPLDEAISFPGVIIHVYFLFFIFRKL